MSEPKPKRRWGRRIFVTLLLVIVVFVVHYAIMRQVTKNRLEEALARQDREHPGWRFDDLLAARPDLPDGENAAVQVQAIKRMLGDWKRGEWPWLLSNRPANRRLSVEYRDQLRDDLAPVARPLVVARNLARLDRGKLSIRYTEDILSTMADEMQFARDAVDILDGDACLRCQAGDLRGALENCRAQIVAARSIGDEPLSIAQLARIACVIQGCQSAQRALGHGEAPPEELAALQAVLEKESQHGYFATAMRGERAVLHRVFDAIERGAVTLEPLDQGGRKKGGGVFAFWHQDRTREYHVDLFPPWNRLVEIAGLPTHERAKPLSEVLRKIRMEPRSPITLFMPAAGKIEEVDRRCLGWLRCTIAALAAERYRKQKGAWPAKLDDLKAFAPADALIDPSDGQPLRLLKLPDGILIYSVGPDGIDDGGEIDLEQPSRPETDVGFRLWDPDRRGQPPEPDEPPPPDDPPQ